MRHSPKPVGRLTFVLFLGIAGSSCSGSSPGTGTTGPTTARSSSTSPSPTVIVTQPSLPSPAPTTATTLPAKPAAPDLALQSVPASLTVTPALGPVGTTVTLRATNCPAPSSGYTGFFADSQALGDPQTPGYRHPLDVTTGSRAGEATANYRLTGADTQGFALFEINCGSSTNAVASFSVT